MTIPMAAQARLAFAQLALQGFVVEPKAQTNKRTIPTIGIATRKIVKNHSPKLTSLLVGLGCIWGCSIRHLLH